MNKTTRYPVKKEIILWAIEESQKDPVEISLRFEKLSEWLNGGSAPTIKQLETFSDYLKVPFGYMFLQTPPRENVVQTEFRTINNVIPKISKNLQDTLITMQKRKEWMSDYRKDNGWNKLEIIEEYQRHYKKAADDVDYIKQLLNLKETWFEEFDTVDESFRYIRSILEEHGILIMQNGVVGQDNNRKLDVNEFRAFALYDNVAPLIFINANDSTQGKLFSLVHELLHILNGQEDVIVNQQHHNDKSEERHINNLTAEFLMPKDYVNSAWKDLQGHESDTMKAVAKLSKILKVSRQALAIRLQNLNLVDNNIVNRIATEPYMEKRNALGGNYYTTYRTRMSPSFFDAVVGEADSGRLGFTYAYDLLGGIKSKNYNKIKETMILSSEP